MPPVTIAIAVSSSVATGASIVVGSAAIVALILAVITCACGNKKEKADELPAADDKPAPQPPCEPPTPEPDAPPADSPASASVKEKSLEKSVTKEPDDAGAKSFRPMNVSLMMKEAQDLELMSKIEGPRGAGQSFKPKSPRSVKSAELPSLRLMGKSIVAAPAKGGSTRDEGKSTIRKSKSVGTRSGSLSTSAQDTLSIIGAPKKK